MSQDSFRQELMQPDGLRTEKKIQAQICAGCQPKSNTISKFLCALADSSLHPLPTDRWGEQSKQRKDNLLSEKTLSRTITHFIKNFFPDTGANLAYFFNSLTPLTIWMTTVGSAASRIISITAKQDNGSTENNPRSGGTKSTSPSSTLPDTNARILYGFPVKPNAKMLLFPRQLNPWKRRANVSVANAIVDAIAAPFPFPI